MRQVGIALCAAAVAAGGLWAAGCGGRAPALAPRPTVDVTARVIRIVAELKGVDERKLSPATSFIDDLEMDDLDRVEMIMEFEDAFNLSIPDADIDKLKTIGQAVDYIRQRVK